MTQRTADADSKSAEPAPASAPWGALRYSVFRWLWLATVVSNVGTWMYNAASGWLMTSAIRCADPAMADSAGTANSAVPA